MADLRRLHTYDFPWPRTKIPRRKEGRSWPASRNGFPRHERRNNREEEAKTSFAARYLEMHLHIYVHVAICIYVGSLATGNSVQKQATERNRTSFIAHTYRLTGVRSCVCMCVQPHACTQCIEGCLRGWVGRDQSEASILYPS